MALAPRSAVPESWMAENGGPWHLAPPHLGGQRHYFSPLFSYRPTEADFAARVNATPPPPPPPDGPPEFVALYGPRPKAQDYPLIADFFRELADWENALRDFTPTTEPPPVWWVFQNAQTCWRYGMGTPVLFKTAIYGWTARFAALTRKVPGITYYDVPAYYVMSSAGNVVSGYQINMSLAGLDPTDNGTWPRHPWVPPQLWPDGVETEQQHGA